MDDLEALLTDLQTTTELLKRANRSDRYSPSDDKEPIYQVQRTSTGGGSHGLDHLEQLLNDYSQKRNSNDAELRPSAATLLTQLDTTSGSKKSPSPHNGNMMHTSSGGAGSAIDLHRRTPTTKHSGEIDSMLGTLQSDMSKHGISTIPKGDCAACGKTIIGQVVIALGKMWHPEHYLCSQCNEELGHRNFFERGGKAYCENDYHNLFSPRCAYCNGPIKDRCVTALDKTFHVEHFCCHECGREFGDEAFHEKDGNAYCRNDFFRMFAPKCRGCRLPISNNFVTALGTHWHQDCFQCQECGCSFQGGSFFDHDGAPLCETHYHERRGSLCAACKKPISGRCVSAMSAKFHPEHFCCAFCHRQLNKGTFKEYENKSYCHKCYEKLINP